MTLTHGELFAGISGFGLGFSRSGIVTKWHVEIDPKCQNVLRRHYPDAEIFSDVRECGAHNLKPVDIISFGSPCQDLSVAGKRKGLSGERSGLFFEAARIIRELRPALAVWENVPGALSSNDGRDFGAVLDALAESGALDIGWAILDAQWFGVAQRRRRLFVVADFREQRAAQILSIPYGGGGDTPPERETGQAAPTLFASGAGTERTASAGSESEFCIPVAIDIRNNREQPDGISGTLQSKKSGGYSLNYQNPVVAFSADRDGGDLPAHHNAYKKMAVAWHGAQITSPQNKGGVFEDVTPTLNSDPRLMTGVRRLTPTECERLQGFPDGWTDGQADSARYRQLGNAVCVNVAEWIGWRIAAAPALRREGE